MAVRRSAGILPRMRAPLLVSLVLGATAGPAWATVVGISDPYGSRST